MTQTSRFWDGTTTGDATVAPYSSTEFAGVWFGIIGQNNNPPWQRSFVSTGGFGAGSLLVTGTGTPISVAAGIAFVAGYWYQSDASENIAVSTPAANPRIDRVVLRADWSAQTVRMALLGGAEAATPSPPALTQTFGTTWEVSLAQVYVTTGGVITIRDERLANIGLGNSVLFRDIAGRLNEEFFDHFNIGSGSATTLSSSTQLGWVPTLTGTGAATVSTTSPSAVNLTTGATGASTGMITRGSGTGSNFFPTRFNQAPLLLEASMGLMAAADGNATGVMRLTNTGNSQMIELGVIGATSTANIVLRSTNAGTTAFNTGTAFGAGYHTFGIFVPASGGPVIALYDGVPIAQVAATLPAAATDLRAEFYVANGATASARAINVDWVRLVRGTQ